MVESGAAVSAEDAEAIIGISGYAGISSDIDIADDAASLISANDAVLNATGVDHIRVDGGIGEGGYGVNAADGAVLTSFSAEIDFDVVDTAQAIAAEVTGTDIRDGSSNSASDLDDAGHIFITGGSVNVADANAIQNISGYDDGVYHSGVDYEIKDSVTNIKNSSDSVLTNGNINVTATNVANAMDGAALNAFTADIDFDVADTAINLADQVDGTNGATGSLDDAANIEVLSGTAVDVADAMAIQGISGYTGAGDLDIEDTAAALISAGDTVLNQTGVDHVKASDSSVLASVGAQLNGFTAEIEFDVSDEAANIATNAGNLGEADDVIVVSGGADVTVSQAESIQNLSGYDDALSTFTIADNSAAVISATDSVLTDGNIHVDVTNTVGASDGAILNAFTADIDFDVVIRLKTLQPKLIIRLLQMVRVLTTAMFHL